MLARAFEWERASWSWQAFRQAGKQDLGARCIGALVSVDPLLLQGCGGAGGRSVTTGCIWVFQCSVPPPTRAAADDDDDREQRQQQQHQMRQQWSNSSSCKRSSNNKNSSTSGSIPYPDLCPRILGRHALRLCALAVFSSFRPSPNPSQSGPTARPPFCFVRTS